MMGSQLQVRGRLFSGEPSEIFWGCSVGSLLRRFIDNITLEVLGHHLFNRFVYEFHHFFLSIMVYHHPKGSPTIFDNKNGGVTTFQACFFHP